MQVCSWIWLDPTYEGAPCISDYHELSLARALDLLNLLVEGPDEGADILECFDTVPVAHAMHDFQFLLARSNLLEHLLAPCQRRALIFFPSQDQHWNIDLAVVRRLCVDDGTTIRHIPSRVLS